VTRESRTAAISAATIVCLIAVGIAIAVACRQPEPEPQGDVTRPNSAWAHDARAGLPGQPEAKKREDESRQWADELHKVLVSTPEYQKEFEVGDASLDDAMRSADTALEEVERRTR